MPARHILIFYGTSYGQTAKIARRMDDLLTASGETVTLVDASNQPRGLTPREFDGVIIGGSIIRGRHQKSVRRFVHTHWDVLNAMPSAFFSVSPILNGHPSTSKKLAAWYRIAAVFLAPTSSTIFIRVQMLSSWGSCSTPLPWAFIRLHITWQPCP